MGGSASGPPATSYADHDHGVAAHAWGRGHLDVRVGKERSALITVATRKPLEGKKDWAVLGAAERKWDSSQHIPQMHVVCERMRGCACGSASPPVAQVALGAQEPCKTRSG